MRVKRSRGALSGLLLIVLGAWVAIIPFVGPLFDYSVGPNSAWTWTAGRLWQNLLPGAAVVLAGIVVLGAGRRGPLAVASWVATVGGLWIVVAPEVSRLWNGGVVQSGGAYGGTHRQVVEALGFSLLSGAVIAAIGGLSLGRSSLTTVDDLRYANAARAEEIRSVEPEPYREPVTTGSSHRRSLFRRDPAIDLREREPVVDEPTTTSTRREDASEVPRS